MEAKYNYNKKMKYLATLAIMLLLSAPSVENKKLNKNSLAGDMDVDAMYSFSEKDDVAREIEAAKEQIK